MLSLQTAARPGPLRCVAARLSAPRDAPERHARVAAAAAGVRSAQKTRWREARSRVDIVERLRHAGFAELQEGDAHRRRQPRRHPPTFFRFRRRRAA
jgi:hypothetical protein